MSIQTPYGPVALALHSYSLRLRYVHDPDYDVFSFLDDAAARGFDGVNLSLSGPDNHLLRPHRHLGGNTDGHLDAVHAALAGHGLSLELDTDSVRPDRLAQAVQLAHRLGAAVLRTFTHHPYGPDLVERTGADLRATLPLAEQAGVTIAVENHEEFTSAELRDLAREIGHPRLRLLFDFGNGIPVLEDPREALQTMAPWLAACHVKDVVLIRPEQTPDGRPAAAGVALGDGSLDLVGLTEGVLRAGLRRLCLQNVWGYHVPVGKLRPIAPTDPRLGRDPFRYLESPWEPRIVALDPETTWTPDALITAEADALTRATARLFDLVRGITTG